MAIHSTYFLPKKKKLCAKIQLLSKRAYFHNGTTKYMTPCIKEHLNEKMSWWFTSVSPMSPSASCCSLFEPQFSFLHPFYPTLLLLISRWRPLHHRACLYRKDSSLGLTLQPSTCSTPTNAFCPLEQSFKKYKNWAPDYICKTTVLCNSLVGTVFCPMNS